MMLAGGASMVYHFMSDDDVDRIMKHPHVAIASDSSLLTMGEGVPHPRGYGNNARVLGEYVRARHVIPIEEAIRKMTSLPAAQFHFAQRGLVKEGYAADLVVFDPAAVGDRATFEQPHAYASGIPYVFVNGVAVVSKGEQTSARPGTVLTPEVPTREEVTSRDSSFRHPLPCVPSYSIPPDVEEYRDERWSREATRQVETASAAERFIEHVGFAACLTDSRRPGPSLYVAVCGRRDVVMPRNVQKDPEASLTWVLKDELIRRGRVYYAKLARGKTMFLAPRMIPYFHAVWGVRRRDEKRRLSRNARAILRVLRGEWEMGTADLRDESGVKDRQAFTRGLDELQAAMIVVPSEVYYQPKFTYIWSLGIGRFPDALVKRVTRDAAVREIARCFLAGAGMTVPGELARVTGLSRPEAGRGNRALVAEGYATMPSPGTYQLAGPLGPTIVSAVEEEPSF